MSRSQATMWIRIVTILTCYVCFAEASLDDSARCKRKTLLGKIIEPPFLNKCFKDLGCFYIGPPFFQIPHRLASLPPTNNVLGTEFLLFTPSSPTDSQILTSSQESLTSSHLDPTVDTKILIHGYNEPLNEGDIYFQTKDELMRKKSSNVIIVNWTSSSEAFYPQAVADARVVGAQLGKVINYHINNKSIDPKTFHVIGYSLGSHVAGYAGERVRGLGRITALDPAGPFFYHTKKEVRLDPTDANFVDVIHTGSGNNFFQGLGLFEAVGHMDFYPNGGTVQPGCSVNKKRKLCNHIRSRDYFKASIDTCEYVSIKCESYRDFTKGKCTSGSSVTAVMGYHATKLSVPVGTRFYLRTSGKPPYCEVNNGKI